MGDRLKYSDPKHVKSNLNSIRGKDQESMLIEAISGVTTAPLNEFSEIVKYNMIGLGRFDYQSMWADNFRDLAEKRPDA